MNALVQLVLRLWSALFTAKETQLMASKFWNSLLSWGVSTAKSEGQKLALKAINDATAELAKQVKAHAPDMAPAIEPLLQQVVTSAVAGIATRK